MKYIIELPFRLPSFNQYSDIERRNKFEASNFKKGIQGDIIWAIRKAKPPKIYKPVKITFTWIEKNKKRDLDNIFSAKKFILDALVKEGILQNDSQKYVTGLTDRIEHDKLRGDRIIVEIDEVE